MDRIKKIPFQTVVFVLISSVIFFLFFDFFTKGYVMDGAYDRRNNVLPNYFTFLHSFQNLEIPQWNPFLFCGSIFIHNVFFYPLNWIIWLFPKSYIPFLATVVLIIHFFFAGYFIWILLKEVIEDRFWALCGSIAYLLSTASMFSLSSSIEQFSIFVYMPALFYLILTFNKRRLLANFLLQSITLVLFLLIGQIQFLIYVIGFYLIFLLFNIFKWDDRRLKINWQLFSVSAASFLFALLITAVRHIPFYYSTKGDALLKLSSYAEFINWKGYNPKFLLIFFMPQFFAFLNRGEIYNCYTGVFATFLGLYAIFFLFDKKTLFWKVMAIVITLIIMQTPLAYLHYILTGKANLSIGRMALLIIISFSILSAYTGKVIVNDIKQLRRSIIFFTCLFVLIIACSIGIYLNPDSPPCSENRIIEVKQMKNAILHFSVFFVLLTGLLFFLYRSKTRYKVEIFKAIFFVALLIDLLIIARSDLNSQNPFFSPEPFYQSLPREREIAGRFEENGKNFRILGFSLGTSYSRSISLSLYNSSGYDSAPPFYITTLYSYPYIITRSAPVYRHVGPHLSPFPQRALELTSTRYIIYDNFIQEIPSSLPRYSLYNNFVVISDDNEALNALLGSDRRLDIHITVVLNDFPDIPVPRSRFPGTIRVLKEGFNDILFEVFSPENTLLLLNDTFNEGWKASIDGSNTKVIRANYAFRAVAVPGGMHRVEFIFSQKGIKAAKTISTISLLLFFIIIMFYFGNKRKSKNGSSIRKNN